MYVLNFDIVFNENKIRRMTSLCFNAYICGKFDKGVEWAQGQCLIGNTLILFKMFEPFTFDMFVKLIAKGVGWAQGQSSIRSTRTHCALHNQ